MKEMEVRRNGPPLCLVSIENSKLEKAVITGNGFTIIFKENELSLPSIMTTLLAVYYTQELDFPAIFLSPIAVFIKWTMKHEYYKLSNRAAKIDVIIKKHW